MSLYIYVEDERLRNKYREYITTRRTTDSGVDLFIPEDITLYGDATYKIHLRIVVGAKSFLGVPAPCLLLPRSSISKTPLRLANSIGLIDSGYRGEVCAMVDNIHEPDYEVYQHERLFQICSHDFMPFTNILLVDKLEDLPTPLDNRGSGGFGSTGK